VRDALVVIAKSVFWVLVVLGVVLAIVGIIQRFIWTGLIPGM
jgi:cytochrome b subunit of formate dehydrogenase